RPADLPRPAPPLRERRGRGRPPRRHRADGVRRRGPRPAAHGRRHRDRRPDPRRDRRARGTRARVRDQPDPRATVDPPQPGAAMPTTLYEQLTTMTVAVCDTGDITSIKKLTPRDATTNPSLITAAAQMPEYAEVVDGALRWAESEARGSEAAVVGLALDRL